MTAIHVTKFRGSQGSWEAEVTYSDGTKEVLACVHKHYFKRDAHGFYYHDPYLKGIPEHVRSPKLTKQIELMLSKGRVILTTDDIVGSDELDPVSNGPATSPSIRSTILPSATRACTFVLEVQSGLAESYFGLGPNVRVGSFASIPRSLPYVRLAGNLRHVGPRLIPSHCRYSRPLSVPLVFF